MHLPRYYRFLSFLFLSMLFWNCQKSNSHTIPFSAGDSTHHSNSSRPAITPTGVCIGNSIIAGHPWRNSRLEMGLLNYPDSVGQISYHLTQLTQIHWIDQGWGGQTTGQIRNRFLRDAVDEPEDPGDGRGKSTLSGKPSYVVIEGGVNDIDKRVSLDSIETNLVWMASTCMQNGMRCIMLNCVGQGYGVFNEEQIKMISALNKWLASGALDNFHVIVVDINSLWNSGSYGGVSAYGNDNVHFSSLVNSGDGIHFTRAGYDSVANIIFRVAGLP